MIFAKSISPFATFCAASIIYLARKPARSGDKSSTVSFESVSAFGKDFLPLSPSPNSSQRRSIMPFILGILLFCEMINEQSVSQGSWCKMRIPLYSLTACFK